MMAGIKKNLGIAIRQASGNVLFQAGFVYTIEEQNADREKVLKLKL